jgi:hypothetical protein
MAARATVAPKKQKLQRDLGKTSTLEDRIRQRAHEGYLQRGGQDGSELDNWLQAEAETRGGMGELA